MNFILIKANIVNVSADAIVLPANRRLKEGPGASAAIFNAAGRENLAEACSNIGYCKTGSAVPTPAFNLDANYIIHASVPKWRGGGHHEYSLLSSAYFTSLKLADMLRCQSIAFPLLASGNNGFDLTLAFKIAKKSINEYREKNLKSVILVVYDDTELFIKSQGYNIMEINELKHSNQTKEIISRGIESVKKWLGDENNVISLIKYGSIIAQKVLRAL